MTRHAQTRLRVAGGAALESAGRPHWKVLAREVGIVKRRAAGRSMVGTCVAVCSVLLQAAAVAAASHASGAYSSSSSMLNGAGAFTRPGQNQDTQCVGVGNAGNVGPNMAAQVVTEVSRVSGVAGAEERGVWEGAAGSQSWNVVKCCYSNRMMSQADYSVCSHNSFSVSLHFRVFACLRACMYICRAPSSNPASPSNIKPI